MLPTSPAPTRRTGKFPSSQGGCRDLGRCHQGSSPENSEEHVCQAWPQVMSGNQHALIQEFSKTAQSAQGPWGNIHTHGAWSWPPVDWQALTQEFLAAAQSVKGLSGKVHGTWLYTATRTWWVPNWGIPHNSPKQPREYMGIWVRMCRGLSWCQPWSYLECAPDLLLANHPPTSSTEPTGVHTGAPPKGP